MQYITQAHTCNFTHIVKKFVLIQQDIINISVNQDFFSQMTEIQHKSDNYNFL